MDLESQGKRVVETEFASEYGKKYNLFNHLECSSMTGENVEKVFEEIAKKMISLSNSK
jgi:hypothetical protein